MPRSTSRLEARTRKATRLPVGVIPAAVLTALLLAGCGGAAPPPGASTPSASPSPTTSSPAPGATSSASAAPDSDAAAARDAFLAFVQTDPSFHLAGDMLMSVGSLTLQAAIASDISNGNEQGTIDLRGPGVSVRLSVILVDGTVYLRLARRPWESIAGGAAFSNPLGGLRVDGLEPIDVVNVAGVRAHHLRAENPEGLNGQTLSGNTLSELQVTSSSLDVYITPDGVPLTAIVEFAGTGTFGLEGGQVKAKIRYDFTKFGQDVSIVPPPGVSPRP